MAPKTPPTPGQAWPDALDPALLRRLWRRAARPGLARPWQAQAMLARHRRMVGGQPLAELLQRRAEILADGRAAWAPIVYARPAAPPAPPAPPGARGPARPPATRAAAPAGSDTPDATRAAVPAGSDPVNATRAGRPPRTDHPGAVREGAPPRPVVRATAPRAAPWPPGSPPAAAPGTTPAAAGGATQVVQRRPAAPATPPSTPIHPDPPDPRSPGGTQAEAVATPGAVLPGPAAAARVAPPELPAVTRTADAGAAAPRDQGGAPPPAAPPAPARPVVEPTRPARPPGAPALVLVSAAPPSPPAPPPGGIPPGGIPPGGIPPGRTPSSLPVVRPEPGWDGDRNRPAPWAADAQTGRAGAPALPVVREHLGPAPGPNRAWAAPAGVPAPLPLAPAPAAARGPAGVPAAPMAPSAGPALRQPPPLGPGTRAAAGPVPAARGPEADRGRGLQPRPQRAVLAPVEIDRIADKVQRKLLHRLAIEGERRGTPR
jgi:hypothetical protein